jgi:hypothetical protein
MAKRNLKTSREEEAEKQQEYTSKQHQGAKTIIYGILQLQREIAGLHSKEANALRGDLEERLEWMLRENEAFRDIAAQFWLQQQGIGGICVGMDLRDKCNQDENPRPRR